ncbi:MAG: glycoside hydrolase family 3 protein [Thermoanaerobaculia bacterium]
MLPLLHELSLEERVGQLFVPGANGRFMNATSPTYRRLERLVRERHVGGIIWFESNVYETAFLNRRLQAASRAGLLISADLEAGMGMRFFDTTFWPPAMAIAATGDVTLAERAGRAVAIESRAVGVNHILAPVCDVNVHPDNPVINARSFGEDPAAVARYSCAFLKGVQSERVLATAKHFPGHGDTHVDSHRTLPTLDVSRERLERVELVPFRAAIDAGVASVMIGHLAVPALDPSGDPATVSSPIINDLLRRHLGFNGLVVSDAFDMGGLIEKFHPGEAAVRAIEAGQDQILMPEDVDAAIDAVIAAVKSGRISAQRVDESVRRILEAKRRTTFDVASDDEIFRIVDSEASRDLAAEIAQRAITRVRESPGALPIAQDARVVTIVISELTEAANPLPELEDELSERLDHEPQIFFLDAPAIDAAAAVEAASRADVVLLAFAVRAKSGAGTIAIPPAARQAIEQITMSKVIAVSFGSPYLLRESPNVPTYLCAYGVQPPLQVAAVQALFSEIPIDGKLPVKI